MSKKNNVETPQQEEKIVTRYDRRMQKRKEQEEKDRREQKIFRIVCGVVLAVVLCFIASFPIRNYMAVNQTYVKVGGEKVSKVEFDYYYNMALSNYYNQYGMYLSYMGVDLSGDLTTQMYSDTLTWDDYIEQMAVGNIRQEMALLAEAEANGFEYDTAAKYDAYVEMMKDAAAEEGVSFNDYVRSAFGSYATIGRLKDTICDSMKASAYSEKIAEEKAPSEDEIVAYYEENKDDYDSVDYRIIQIDAELPTEPTELADPVEETASTEDAAEATDATEATDSTEEAEEEEYEPSEAEIAAAMAEAKEKAEAAVKTISTEGDLREDYAKSYLNSNYSDWLFDASRKEGDTTVVEDTNNNRYYVVEFVKRYLKEEPTANLRIIMTEDDPQAIVDEWNAGAATEDSFIELFNKYSTDTVSTEGGLYEGLTSLYVPDEMGEWMFAEDRAAGDVTAIAQEDSTSYVAYFVSLGDYEWKLDIKSTLLNETMADYLSELIKDYQVEDPKGNLEYLTVQKAAEESAAAATEETAATETKQETAREEL